MAGHMGDAIEVDTSACRGSLDSLIKGEGLPCWHTCKHIDPSLFRRGHVLEHLQHSFGACQRHDGVTHRAMHNIRCMTDAPHGTFTT